MTSTPPDDSRFPYDEILDELFQQKPLGGDHFLLRTLEAVREDARVRRARRLRRLVAGASALAASVAFAFSLWQTPGAEEIQVAEKAVPSEADVVLYGEMLALESLLEPADVFALEENRQTLDFLILLTQQ